MRILVHDYAGHPFQVQLSRGLAQRGHEVRHVYAASVVTPRGELQRQSDDPETFEVTGITLSGAIPKANFVRRFYREREYGQRLSEACREFRPEVVLSANAPSLVQHRLACTCRRWQIRLVGWIQDLYGEAAYRILKMKLPGAGHLVGQYFRYLDRAAAAMSAELVVITEDFVPLLEGWGIPRERIHVVQNWAPLDSLPLRPRENRWSQLQELTPGLRIVYSGTLAFKHNPELLLRMAEGLSGEGTVIVISEGEGIEWLRRQAMGLGLTNLVCLPFQPFSEMADVFASADILVAILEPDAGVFSVPSKVLSYLCAGRPLLAAIPAENLAARIIARQDAGLVVSPLDVAGFVAAARRLHGDPELRRKMGCAARQYAEENFDFDVICSRFEAVLASKSVCTAAAR